MKPFLTALLVSFGAVHAAPLDPQLIANMAAQSDAVMNAGLCQVANDSKDYGTETVLVILPKPIGVRRIPKNTYNRMRATGYSKTAGGAWGMTEWIGRYCSIDGMGDECLAARSFWKQVPLNDAEPSSGVSVATGR